MAVLSINIWLLIMTWEYLKKGAAKNFLDDFREVEF